MGCLQSSRRCTAFGLAGAALALLISFGCDQALRLWPKGCCLHLEDVRLATEKKSQPSCPTRQGGFRVEDLKEKGFAVMSDLLTPEEVEDFLALRRSKMDDSFTLSQTKGGVRFIFPFEIRSLHPKLSRVLQEAQADSGIYVGDRLLVDPDCIDGKGTVMAGGQFFHTNSSDPSSANLEWHQDIEIGFLHPESAHHFSVYIFLEKSVPGSAGLSLVPWDTLRRASPKLHDLVRGTASRDFYDVDMDAVRTSRPELYEKLLGELGPKACSSQNCTAIFGNERDERAIYHGNLDSLACTPELLPGDAIIFRSDVIHRTQRHTAAKSWRTSMNLRLGAVRDVDFKKLLSGGLTKFASMNQNPMHYIAQLVCSMHAHRRPAMCPESGFPQGGYGLQAWICGYSMMKIGDVASGLAIFAAFRAGLWYRKALFQLRLLLAWLQGEIFFSHRA